VLPPAQIVVPAPHVGCTDPQAAKREGLKTGVIAVTVKTGRNRFDDTPAHSIAQSCAGSRVRPQKRTGARRM
jgi:hypothetical protein